MADHPDDKKETPEGMDEDLAPVSEAEENVSSHLNRLMTYNFLEFASYVIKDRAIPDIDDGLKPVQRRILHTLNKVDDGKYHKVANIVGEAMKYHPHGDSSIYGALVNIANKEFFIDKQGNFGNILTGDNASAARYIECRLTPLAREVLFNKETTVFVDSYDGRNLEPVALPAKVPVLLMQGAEGIAVGMATKVFSHNFNELLKAQIDILRHRRIRVYPDFPQGGMVDVSQYEDGAGKVKVRGRIEKINKNTLVIREVPAGTTTESLISRIEDATKAGKIKLSSINDYTAAEVEIELKVSRGADVDRTLEALYAFTACETSLSSNITIIKNNRPVIYTVSEVLHHNTQKLVDFLRWELEIEEEKLNQRYHDKTLEQIFIENRLYKLIEQCKEEEAVYEAVFTGLEPFRDRFRRDVSRDDIDRLLRIPIRRISLFDISKNRRELDDILAALEKVRYNLAHLKDFTINFIKELLTKYGKAYPRRTEIKELQTVDAKAISLADVKVGLDRKAGYIGTSVNGADTIQCTEFDKLVVVYKNGKMKVVNQADKIFLGRFMDAFPVNKGQIYNIIYRENSSGICYHKRCKIDRFIVDKEYQLCPDKHKIELFETNYGIVLDCVLEDTARSKDQSAELIFDDIPVRSTTAKGFKTANRKITKFLKKKRGTEKSPDLESAEVEVEDLDEEAIAKKAQGWRSKFPIRFTALEPVIEAEVEEVLEEEEKVVRVAALPLKEVMTEVKDSSALNAILSREVPVPEPVQQIQQEEVIESSKEASVEEFSVADFDESTEDTSVEKVVDASEEEVVDASEEEVVEETSAPEEEVNETVEEEVTEAVEEDSGVDGNSQPSFELPEESEARRYLIDEDNPFMLEP
ncbi:MAG: DNA topoisomerase IV subunit A [Lentisphaeraceae bacterium]|nr:DNA topoisomerase IV subunit A [Lentisphaeraceae bacterium]